MLSKDRIRTVKHIKSHHGSIDAGPAAPPRYGVLHAISCISLKIAPEVSEIMFVSPIIHVDLKSMHKVLQLLQAAINLVPAMNNK